VPLCAIDRDGGPTLAQLALQNGRTAVLSVLDRAVVAEAVEALEQSKDVIHKNTAADLCCPISSIPFATEGEERPVRLPDGEHSKGSVLSASTAERLLTPTWSEETRAWRRLEDPVTRRPFSREEAAAFLRSTAFTRGDPTKMADVVAVRDAWRAGGSLEDRLTAAAAAVATAGKVAEWERVLIRSDAGATWTPQAYDHTAGL